MKTKYSWLLCILSVGLTLALVGCAETDPKKTEKQYGITIDPAIEHGTVQASALKAVKGTEITLTVTPDNGYVLKPGSLKYNGTAIDESAKKFIMPDSEAAIAAEFVKLYAITIDSSIEDGTLTADPMEAIAGTVITVTVTPDAGYYYVESSLKYNGTGIDDSGAEYDGDIYIITFAMPEDDAELFAEFEESTGVILRKITVASTVTNGAITADPNADIVPGTKITVTVTPDTDYILSPGSLGPSALVFTQVDDTTFTFIMPDGNITLSAAFILDSNKLYTITIPVFANGSVSMPPPSAKAGDTITVTVSPDSGYKLRSGSLKYGSTSINEDTLEFIMPAENITISAEFEEIEETAASVPPYTKLDYSACYPELDAIVAQMTTAEKAGQMTQADRSNVNNASVTNLFLGSVLSGGGSGPNGFGTTMAQWWSYTNGLVNASLGTRLKIPLVYGTDVMHGHANALYQPNVFPHNIGLGAIAVADLETGTLAAYEQGKEVAREMLACGIRMHFGPMLEYAQNMRWGRVYETYSEDMEIVKAMGPSYIQGLQETRMVGATGKDYVGEGQLSYGSGKIAVTLNASQIQEALQPYKEAIDRGLLAVMTSYISVNGTKMVRNNDLVNDWLKGKDYANGQLGFEGFVISNWNDMGTSTSNVSSSINAGLDMAIAAEGTHTSYITGLTSAINNNQITASRINDAVRRILLFKKVFGILGNPNPPEPGANTIITSQDRQFNRETAAKTLVLLKNKTGTDGKTVIENLGGMNNIYIAGAPGNSLNRICGGWTIDWQGAENDTNLTGTTIQAGIQAKMLGKTVTGSEAWNTSYANAADAVIVVLWEGENYADDAGDYLNNVTLRADDISLLNNAYNTGKPVIAVMISGRPIFITTAQLDLMDAFIAAWLPGSEGGGAIADVLFDADKDFFGKTPFTWRTAYNSTVTFGYGTGLKKGQAGTYEGGTP